jgi:hypothetical protein
MEVVMSGSLDGLKSYVHGLVDGVTVPALLLKVANVLDGHPFDSVVTTRPPEPVVAEKPKKRKPPRTGKDYLPCVKWAAKHGLEDFTTERCMREMRTAGVQGIPRDDAVAMRKVANVLSKSAASIINLGAGVWRYRRGSLQPDF